MNLNQLIEQFLHQLHPFENLSSSLIFIGVILCTFVQISPIQINPWDWLLGWIGERFNARINKKINQLDERIDKMKENLDNHIKYKALKDLEGQRRYLINFVNEGVNGLRHSKESFEDALRACDAYEEYVKENHVHNGVINSTISVIREKYKEHLILADFPSEDSYLSNTNGGK